MRSELIRSELIRSDPINRNDAMQNLFQDPKVGLGAIAVLFAGWKGWDVIRAFFAGGGRLLDRTVAGKKIVADTAIAHERAMTDADLGRERMAADVLAAKEARLEAGVWKLIEEGRQAHEQLRSDTDRAMEAMSQRVDALTKEVGRQKERGDMAEVLKSVADIRADDADAARNALRAKLSVALLEIAALQNELVSRDTIDHEREKELASMRDRLQRADRRMQEIAERDC